MYEILLTRVFSITLLYHFGFMVISVGMFGMTVGAIIVYLLPRRFDPQKIHIQLASNSLLFGLSIAVSFFCYAKMPILLNMLHLLPFIELIIHLFSAYILAGIPFTFSGIVVCLALTKLPQPVSRLYAADLIGAALGCLLLLPLLNFLDGASAMFFIAALACCAGFLFATDSKSKVFHLATSVSVLVLILISFANASLASTNQAFIRVPDKWYIPQNERLYEKWNSFSRILVHGNPAVLRRPMAWGLSTTWPQDKKVSELILTIDSNAHTPLTRFSGNWHDLEYLQHDVINAVHQIKHNADVFIIGVGGGRDVLSSLFFHQKHILAVEINDRILDCLTRIFGDYTGHIDRYPRVQLVNDEARSFLGRSKQKFDIIQISLVDSFAATASGAFVFTENALYTSEAWKMFLVHLKPSGVLSVSYWYYTNIGFEVYRFLALAVSALKNSGVDECRQNIVVIANLNTYVATILISKRAFSEQDLNKIESFAKENKFTIMLSPKTALDATCAQITSAKDLKSIIDDSSLNLVPPTDNSPFFFHVIKPKDVLKSILNMDLLDKAVGRESAAIKILLFLLVEVVFLSFICIFLPLILSTDRSRLLSIVPLLVYFSFVGLGFMFIEIAQMQRLILFLGHPIYGLSIVLFTLLLGSGIGSYCNSLSSKYKIFNKPIVRLGGLLIALVLFESLASSFIPLCRDGSMSLRIALSITILFPLGFFMGMPFPIGLVLSKHSFESLAPWLWGVNGAASVCASVLALAVSLTFGLSATFWTGFALYCTAFLAYLWASSGQLSQNKL